MKQVTISMLPWILPFEKENYPNYLLRDGPRHRLGRRVGPDLYLQTGLVDRALRLNNISLEIPLSFKAGPTNVDVEERKREASFSLRH